MSMSFFQKCQKTSFRSKSKNFQSFLRKKNHFHTMFSGLRILSHLRPTLKTIFSKSIAWRATLGPEGYFGGVPQGLLRE